MSKTVKYGLIVFVGHLNYTGAWQLNKRLELKWVSVVSYKRLLYSPKVVYCITEILKVKTCEQDSLINWGLLSLNRRYN